MPKISYKASWIIFGVIAVILLVIGYLTHHPWAYLFLVVFLGAVWMEWSDRIYGRKKIEEKK